jgi:hypothetical protein
MPESSNSSSDTKATTTPPANRLITLPPGTPQYTGGYQAIAWATRYLVQPNGPKAGQPWEPTRGQYRYLLWWYAVDEDGRWLYNHGARRLSKGSGKSPFAAVQALIELCGPCRLHDFDPTVHGGVIFRPVDMPLVQIAATAESQTSNTMRMVRAYAPKGSKVVEEHNLDPGKTQYYRLPEGELKVITSSFTAVEGAEASFVVADETEHWKPSNGGPELMATLQDNLAKSGSRLLETSNAWEPGIETVAEATWDGFLAQEEGRTRGTQRILYDARIAPPDTRLDNERSLTEALRFVYADAWWQDIHALKERIWAPTSRPDDSKRKYLNWPTAAVDAWVEPEQWHQLADPDIEVADKDRIVMFFDGSKSRDGTALVGCRVSDGHVFTLGVWEPDPNDPNDTVDVNAVDFAVRRAFDRFKVAAFFADVREWESYALSEWPNRYRDQLDVPSAPHARPPQSIAWDMRGHAYEFAKATEACHADILEGAFTHDGHPAVARHIINAKRRPYRDAIAIGKESPASPRKIDAAVCVIGARMVRRIVLGNDGRGKGKRPSRIVV